jgi:peptidyl-tRNA hydrolase
LGGKKFPQLRVGISHDKRYLLADWVLGNFTLEEKKVIATKKNSIIQGVLKWIKGSSFEKLMNDFNN